MEIHEIMSKIADMAGDKGIVYAEYNTIYISTTTYKASKIVEYLQMSVFDGFKYVGALKFVGYFADGETYNIVLE